MHFFKKLLIINWCFSKVEKHNIQKDSISLQKTAIHSPSVISKDSKKRSSNLIRASASYNIKRNTVKPFHLKSLRISVKLKFTNCGTRKFIFKKKSQFIETFILSIFQAPISDVMKSLTSTWNPRIKAFTKSAAFVRALTSLVSLQVCFKRGTHYRWWWKR